MRAAVETMHGRSLKDREVPSKSLIALKLEQVEDGAPIAEDLREVTSLEDAHVEAYGARHYGSVLAKHQPHLQPRPKISACAIADWG